MGAVERKDTKTCARIKQKILSRKRKNDVTMNAQAGVIIKTPTREILPTLSPFLETSFRRRRRRASGPGIVSAEGFEITDGVLGGGHVCEVLGGAEPVANGHRHRRQLDDALMTTASRHLRQVHVTNGAVCDGWKSVS